MHSSPALILSLLSGSLMQIPIHMIGGIWGSIAVGIFAVPSYLNISHPLATSAGLFYSDGKLLACQFIGVLFVVGWVRYFWLPPVCWYI